MPAILQGCRSIFRGEFPDFDPCQLIGIPSAGKGCLFFPPTIVSYAIARFWLGNESYTLEVFAALHLLTGYVALYAAARTAGLRPALAYVFGISFVLSGYILLVGRSWYTVLTLVFWLPLLFCCMENWFKGRANWKWLLATGFAIGGFYYTGFPQHWFYTMLLFGITALVPVICGRFAVRQLMWPLAACLLGLALLLPTLTVQLEPLPRHGQKRGQFRHGFRTGTPGHACTVSTCAPKDSWACRPTANGSWKRNGIMPGVSSWPAQFLSLGALLAYRCRRAWLGQHPWTVPAIVALWLGLGKEGLLWTLVGHLPVIRALNHHPHRLMPLFVFFALIVGGIFLEQLFAARLLENGSM